MFGNVEFVRAVISISPDLCLAGDRFGRIPLHLAIIKGKSPVVQELVRAKPLAAREKIDGGGNSLHLCIKYNQLNTLKFLLEGVQDDDFINRKDDDGMTILHLAVCDNQIETIEYLVRNNAVQVNLKNANGSTPLDLSLGDGRNTRIPQILALAGAVRGIDIDLAMAEAENGLQEDFRRSAGQGSNDWLSKKKDAIMSDKKQLSQVIRTSVMIWCGVMLLLLIGNTLRLIRRCGGEMFAKPRRHRTYRAQQQMRGMVANSV
ncbi:OLC1v1029322C1 [Oldenlandia corymbosa var. corymbosa]|uniref:OLC1v1029322C1 n=1 Tax=Oldenlandia corymbosa var. corymbosa TaxID=529605 RepID=A0AAV1CDP7_OLDCO|nr:OLC1v1029322C1 [Oldenlandia corymbosa var. corymbosa]